MQYAVGFKHKYSKHSNEFNINIFHLIQQVNNELQKILHSLVEQKICGFYNKI